MAELGGDSRPQVPAPAARDDEAVVEHADGNPEAFTPDAFAGPVLGIPVSSPGL